ncbi:MAG: glutamate-cysteine ligase family protein, partial [Gemmatimonadota bacterium]|nr:glutamate-cysteine ligase family protein [Gemmatimonadota bacterium]
MTDESTPLGLFEGYGVEVELMIVDVDTLDVKPVCDALMHAVAGAPVSDLERGNVAWSNELVLHVLELKTNGPWKHLAGIATGFQENGRFAGEALRNLNARLMPGAVHPWMDPALETRLWPHEFNDVYRTFDRIFGCSGHGWSNLQSTHVNLPFADDDEFARLHAAIRLVLPLIPGLAAGSPYLDGRRGVDLDGRMRAYAGNAVRVPSVSGGIIPGPASTRREYEERILEPIYTDMVDLDPEGILRHEWVNARGAIARFDRDALEIRVIDAQECMGSNLAVVAAIVQLVRALTEGPLSTRDAGVDPQTESLRAVFDRAMAHGEHALVEDPKLLGVLGFGRSPV